MKVKHEDMYEGESAQRLACILSVAISTLKKYGGRRFDDLIYEMNKINSNLIWDSYGTLELDANGTTQFLQKLNKELTIGKIIFNDKDNEVIDQIIEPLEIVIVELQLGYCDE